MAPFGGEHPGTEEGSQILSVFTDEEVFRGLPLPEEEDIPMVSATTDVTTTTDIPSATDVPEAQPVPKAMPEEKAPKFAGWEKIIHPSQPV